METELEMTKGRPKIQVVLTRDSVCAGDDGDAPHGKNVEVYPFLDPEAFAKEISAGYLPSVAGVGHSWTCVLNDVGVAEIRHSGIEALVHDNSFLGVNHVHFVYHSARF